MIPNRLHIARFALLVCALPLLLRVTAAEAQINFALSVGDGMYAEGLQNLDFTQKNGGIVRHGDMVTVALSSNDEPYLGAIEVIAAKGYEIDVDIIFDTDLRPPAARFDRQQTLPVEYSWSYNNKNPDSCDAHAVAHATGVPAGFSTARFESLPYGGTTPGLPPAPMHGGINGGQTFGSGDDEVTFRREAVRVCLFFGGFLDTVPIIPNDTYSAEIVVNIRYSEPL